ncbi:hypothetical protein SRHO_G00201540 [Serrasalmus rhombeus]
MTSSSKAQPAISQLHRPQWTPKNLSHSLGKNIRHLLRIIRICSYSVDQGLQAVSPGLCSQTVRFVLSAAWALAELCSGLKLNLMLFWEPQEVVVSRIFSADAGPLSGGLRSQLKLGFVFPTDSVGIGMLSTGQNTAKDAYLLYSRKLFSSDWN